MDKSELIEMLQALIESAKTIQTPDTGCGFSTLMEDVKEDSFRWVIEETIKELKGGAE